MNNPNIPHHVAIIMDGNGRWAKQRGLPKIAGHREGAKSVRLVIEAASELGIKVLTLYTFSTENWSRPKTEVDALFRLLAKYLEKEADSLQKNNIRFMAIGDLDGLPASVRDKVNEVARATRHNEKLILNLALNYGGRSEITNAARSLARDVASGAIKESDIDEKLFSDYLYTRSLPDPDLLIRTSGEMRISNFLLWQISYSEVYVTEKLWPDFRSADLKKAVRVYQGRERRFGG